MVTITKKAVSTTTKKELAEAKAKTEKKEHQERIAFVACDTSFTSACASELFAQNTFNTKYIVTVIN